MATPTTLPECLDPQRNPPPADLGMSVTEQCWWIAGREYAYLGQTEQRRRADDALEAAAATAPALRRTLAAFRQGVAAGWTLRSKAK